MNLLRHLMMNRQTTWMLVRSPVAALVLLASAVLAPSRVEASCGDYVMVGGRHIGHHADSNMAGHGSPANHTASGGQDPAVPRCHGPMCSNHSFPPVFPAPKIEVAVERWAIPVGTALTMLPASQGLPSAPCAIACDGCGLSILRPPR